MTPCQEFEGHRNAKGYGKVSIGGRPYYAHRLAYAMYYGEDPGGMMVCHLCDNPSCINPEHLFLGTAQDNVSDMIAKGRGVWPGPRRSHTTKLTHDNQMEIAMSAEKNVTLARRFGVSAARIGQIKRQFDFSSKR